MLVVRRRDNGKLACIGGFVNVGETLQEAVRREVQEETGLQVASLRMIPQVSQPKESKKESTGETNKHATTIEYQVAQESEKIEG